MCASDAGRWTVPRIAAALALVCAGPADARKLPSIAPGAALQALGGLAAPLAAEGWTLTPMRGSTVQPGDIVDPVDNQVQIAGPDCFAVGAVRSGQGVSASVEQALSVGARVRQIGGRVGASAGHSLDVGIRAAEIAELPVASLKPSPVCVDQLLALADQGYAVADFVVVQSVLYADLTLAACLEAEASGAVAVVGSLDVSAADCRGLDATRAALGVRTEPVGTALGLAGVQLEGGPSTPPVVPPKRRKKNGPPCWIDAPCAPYVPDTHLVAVGSGPTMAAADQAARAALLQPFALRARAVQAAVGGTAADLAVSKKLQDGLLASVQVAERYQGDAEFYSLAVLERAPLAAELRAETEGAARRLQELDDSDPVAAVRTLCPAVAVARENAFRHAQLSALQGRPSRARPGLAELRTRCDAARAALQVAVPPGRAGDLLAVGLAARGFTAVAPDSEAAHVRITVRSEPQVSSVSGFQQVRIDGVAQLAAAGIPPQTVEVSATGASKDAAKATRTAERDFDEQLAAAVTDAMERWL